MLSKHSIQLTGPRSVVTILSCRGRREKTQGIYSVFSEVSKMTIFLGKI